MRFVVNALTHPDHADGKNQDAVIARRTKLKDGRNICFAIVADGSGVNGQIASASIARAFDEWFLSFKDTDNADTATETIYKIWDAVFRRMSRRFWKELGESAYATAAVFLCIDDTWLMANVGDVRVYEVTPDGVSQLSMDHTYAAREVALGHMEYAEAEQDPQAFSVLQAVGKTKEIIPSHATGKVNTDAMYIVCSDGFYHKNRKSYFYKNFQTEEMTDENEALQAAKGRAISEGETDDISAVLIKGVE